MNLSSLDWTALDRLRELFLAGDAQRGAYWRTRSDLACYDATFGERIGWKWDAVLRELQLRGWSPPPGPLLDFGCGSGIAGRRVIAAFGPERFSSLTVHDHSPLAEEFAAERARDEFPGLVCARAAGEDLNARPLGTLVVSHVLNELPAAGRAALKALAARAAAVLWVEPGTHRDSRDLQAMREELREQLTVIAPCTHCGPCGLQADGNERHWCHHFARPPAGLAADPDWVRFAQHLGIDLRSLPYSFLVLARPAAPPGSSPEAPRDPAGVARVLGRPNHFKGFANLLSCDSDGVRERMLQKRDAPAVFKSLKDPEAPLLFRWEAQGDKVRSVGWWPGEP